jgi:hypothetical protein
MALLTVGRAGVGDQRHKIPEIAGVARRAFDTLVGHYSSDDQRAHL